MKHICMDCEKVMLEIPEIHLERPPVSHGLCSECKDVRIAEHKAEIARRAQRADMEVPVEVLA